MVRYALSAHETVTVRSAGADALEVEAVYAANGRPPPRHRHPDQDEHFEVTEGALRCELGKRQLVVRAGESFDVPRRTPHRMWNGGSVAARAVWRTLPARRTEQWFATVSKLDRPGRRRDILGYAIALREYRDVFRLAARPGPVISALIAAVASVGRLIRRAS